MITEEQIKKLKPGAPLAIHGTFERIAKDGDICIKFPVTLQGFVDNNSVTWAHPSAVSVTKRRYDPYRLFKKGDKVRVVTWNGRDIAHIGQIGRVVSNEYNSKVELAIDGWTNSVYYPACHLELVTPVEELEPYSVLETDTINGFDIMRDGLCVMTFPYGSKEDGYYRNELAAKEAAELECNRLNNLYIQELENNG